MKGINGDIIRLKHMLTAIEEILSYTEGFDLESFLDDSKTRFASIKQLEIIGEAANHVSAETRLRFGQIEWQKITGLRNILVHEYFGVDEKIVWGIIIKDLPKLRTDIQNLIQEL